MCVGTCRAPLIASVRRLVTRQCPASAEQVALGRAKVAIQTAEHKITSSCRCEIRTLCPAPSSSWLLCNPLLSRVCPGNHYRSDPVRVQSTAIFLRVARLSVVMRVRQRLGRDTHRCRPTRRATRLRLRLRLRSLATISQETAQFGPHRRNSIICNCCSLRLMQRQACSCAPLALAANPRARQRFCRLLVVRSSGGGASPRARSML